jgi:hypothetical protein
VRTRFRYDALRAAAASGARVHVVGNGWSHVELPTNVVVHPQTANYEEFLVMAGMSRICLDASAYVGGGNDRLFNYVVNRSFCLTNARAFSSEVFGETGGVGLYSMLELDRLGEAVRSALCEPELLREKAESAARIALRTQNWRTRLECILDAVFRKEG